MNTVTATSERKPNGHLAAAVHGPSCPATFATISGLNQADRPMEAGS